MIAIGRLALFVCIGIPLAGTPSAAATQDTTHKLDYPALATHFLSENGLKDWVASGPAGHRFDEVLDGPAFVRIEVGALDLRIPRRALESPDVADHFRATVRAILDLQSEWFSWRSPEQSAAHAEDWKTVGKWVKSWSNGRLAHADGGRSLYESLDAGEGVQASASALSDLARLDDATVEALGTHGRVVFAPDRQSFLELAALAGWLDSAQQSTSWNDKVLEATIEWVGWTELVAMQYVLLPVDATRPFVGVSMTEQDDTGLVQYMSERAAALLLRREFWRQTAHFFEQTLATNLVIAAAGKNNLRSGDWKLEIHTSGSSSPPYSRFVPGGNPNGGTLPPNPAGPGVTSGSGTEVSLYRKTLGADHFIEPLREAQKLGAKLAVKDKKHRLAEDKGAHFALHALATREDFAVTAPFLGELGEKRPLPPLAFLDDYEEFFRAYRSGFFYWLETQAQATEADSHAKFADLIARHAVRDPSSSLDPIFQEVYGVQLSNEDGSVDSLEWRYLNWLAKKRQP